MSPRNHGGVDPPPTVAGAMWASHVVIMQTSFATIHTRTARETLGRGGRICEFWGVTEDMMVRGGLTEDPAWLEKTSLRMAELMDQAREARLTTPDGTDLYVEVSGRKAIALASTARTPGSFCSLPAGESAIAPVEGTATGKIVGPYLVEHREIERPREPFELIIREGNVVKVIGGIEAQRLERLLAENSPSAQNIAEFAIGTNRRCRVDTGLREAKKAWGTAHIAIGDNQSIGGVVESPLHIDFILLQPTVWLDDREVVRDGKLIEL
ncbi:MAG: aminopeptidase [Thermodesulfobacteriota bacterium]|nr:aminopeptidase [Thermodesulfobacteriota bacterium]